jgi:RNA polymerase sigma factor (sigma-70 family)
MRHATNGAVLKPLRTLFRTGSCAGLTDGQLLERFVRRRDEQAEAAFEALVARHGPMVFGVCRRILGDCHEVEDAFQATFLVLVRKARSLRVEDSLGGWLYTVTHRIAARARDQARARSRSEGPGVEALCERGDVPEPLFDVRPLLHEEIRRLPQKYRAPIVLCYLEEMTHEQAAEQLGWPVGTVRGRLARARETLRSRLTRRGVTLGSASLGAMLAGEAAASVPPAVVESTMRAAWGFAASGATAGTVPAAAAALTMGVLRTMFLTKLGVAAAGLLAAGIVTAGAALPAYTDDPAAPANPTTTPPPNNPKDRQEQPPQGLDQLISLNLNQATLEEALNSIAQYSSLNLVMDHDALAEWGVTGQTPVSLTCKEIRVRAALRSLLQPLHLTFRTEEEGIVLVTAEDRDAKLTAMVRDLKKQTQIYKDYQRRVNNAMDPALRKMRDRLKDQKDLIAAYRAGPRASIDSERDPAIRLADVNQVELESRIQRLTTELMQAKEQLAAAQAQGQKALDNLRQTEKPTTSDQSPAPTPVSGDQKPPPTRASEDNGYLGRTRKEVEDQIVGLVKQQAALVPRAEKLERDRRALEKLQALANERGTFRAAPEPENRQKSGVQQFLEKTGKELETEVAKLSKESQDQADKVKTVQRDFEKLREIHVLLMGNEAKSMERLRALLANPAKEAFTRVYPLVGQQRLTSELENTFESMLRSRSQQY